MRVGAPDGFGSYFLAPRLGPFADLHPGLELQIVATARLFSLSKREADIAIGLHMPQEGRIVGRKLVDYRLYLYASRDYLAAKPEIREKSDLLRHRMIGYIDDLLFTPELDYLPTILPSLKPQIRSANLIAQLQASLSGVGVAVLPRFLARGLSATRADPPRADRQHSQVVLPADVCRREAIPAGCGRSRIMSMPWWKRSGRCSSNRRNQRRGRPPAARLMTGLRARPMARDGPFGASSP